MNSGKFEILNTVEGLKMIREAIQSEKILKIPVRVTHTDGSFSELTKDETKQYFSSFLDGAVHLLEKLLDE